MNIHVNLLKRSEYRYQSPFDALRVASRACLGTTLLAIVVVLLASGTKMIRSSGLRNVNKEWSAIETTVSELKKIKAAEAANRKTRQTLEGSLEGARDDVHRQLIVIQETLPDQACLMHLYIGEEKGFDSKRYTVFRLAGETKGDQGEIAPVQWKRSLSKSETVLSVAGDVLLDRFKPEEDARWSFTLLARSELGEK
jgi:hypothetical protein